MNNIDLINTVHALKRGNLVAFPTETVFGLGGDGLNKDAVERIYKVKNRPKSRPLIMHVPNIFLAKSISSSWTSNAMKLAKKFWPGPLTLILKKSDLLSSSLTAGKQTVGIRIPSHPFALEMLNQFSKVGSGVVAAPSANRFGSVSATRASDVFLSLSKYLLKEDVVVNLNPMNVCNFGFESTIVDCSTKNIKILRLGVIKKSQIELVLGKHVDNGFIDAKEGQTSGSSVSHYAPITPLLVTNIFKIKEIISAVASHKKKIFLWGFSKLEIRSKNVTFQIAPKSSDEYGRILYRMLNDLDLKDFDYLVFERPPMTEEWAAINDRLSKASEKFMGSEF